MCPYLGFFRFSVLLRVHILLYLRPAFVLKLSPSPWLHGQCYLKSFFKSIQNWVLVRSVQLWPSLWSMPSATLFKVMPHRFENICNTFFLVGIINPWIDSLHVRNDSTIYLLSLIEMTLMFFSLPFLEGVMEDFRYGKYISEFGERKMKSDLS